MKKNPPSGGFFSARIRATCHSIHDGYNNCYNNRREAAMKLKITAIGNSAGVILPKELLARLRVDKGDELYALETPDGIRLTIYDATLAAQMEVAERIMREHRDLLRKLADS
jgi:putative addiction module antidote